MTHVRGSFHWETLLILLLFACVSPSLVEVGAPLLNPGEEELAFVYEGPGLLGAWSCDGAGLWLDVGPGLGWPYELPADVLVEVWVSASSSAVEGSYRCVVSVPGRVDAVTVELVQL